MLRALGAVCALHTVEGWKQEAVHITTILYDGLCVTARAEGPHDSDGPATTQPADID
ncbi:MAG: hypothetical protein OJJ54_02645 [Pseudonocardia sp.]|nr:hypothetical protein [Pseudonocardia sp.]